MRTRTVLPALRYRREAPTETETETGDKTPGGPIVGCPAFCLFSERRIRDSNP